MKSIVRCFKARYIEDIRGLILRPAYSVNKDNCLLANFIHPQHPIWDVRIIGGFTSFKIDTGRLFTGYSDNQRRTLEVALQYKTGGIPLSQLSAVENIKREKCYK